MLAGSAKKRRLKTPRGWQVRPTPARVKEALFNILGDRVIGCSFLDLFAGTGSIGIEALSRGAGQAVFVENDPRNIRIIKENLSATGLGGRARLAPLNVADALPLLARGGEAYEIIFMDPPYYSDLGETLLVKISGLGLLKEGGRVIIESSKKDRMPQQAGDLVLYRRERYGDTMLTFYQY